MTRIREEEDGHVTALYKLSYYYYYLLTYLISYYFVERIVLAPVMHHMYKYVGNKKSSESIYFRLVKHSQNII